MKGEVLPRPDRLFFFGGRVALCLSQSLLPVHGNEGNERDSGWPMFADGATTAVTAYAHDFGAVYKEHVGLLVGTAVDHFRICETDAQALAHEVFVAFFLKAHEVRDVRAWLLSGIFNASKNYLRVRARDVGISQALLEQPDPRDADVLRAWPDRLAAREAFTCVTPRCQVALRLRYLEGYSIPEVASELRTSAKYARKNSSRDACVKRMTAT